VSRRGLLAWLGVCAAFAVLDLAGLLDGLLVPVPLMLALLFVRAVGTGERLAYASRLVGAVVAAACLPAATFAWRFGISVGEMSPALVVTGLLAFAATLTVLLVPAAGGRFLRALGLDPASPVHRVVALAFVLTVLDAVALFFELREAGTVEIPFYPSDPLVSVTSDVALALAGIGFGLTRGFRESLARLGLRPLTRRQIVLAVAVAALFQVIVGGLEYLESVLLPSVHALEDRFGYEFVGLPPWVGAVLTSLAAGIGEEVLFRGAIQPRLGIVLTSVLFGALHVQYQVPGMTVIVLIGLGLGIVKERTSTSVVILTHVLYDAGAFLLPEF
jgi:membrane protease YdiL (CAAX protease family)